MRDKIVFFILGAILATLAYAAGDMNLSAVDTEVIEFDQILVNQLLVKEDIIVGKSIAVGVHIPLTPATLGEMLKDPNVIIEARDGAAYIRLSHDGSMGEGSLTMGLLKGQSQSSILSIDSEGPKQIK